PQPNFIVLSDDYYGWIPVPASISAHCWQRIEEYLKGKDPGALAFLEKWYRKDLNDLSGHYILQDFRAGLEGEEIQPLEEQVEQQIGNVLFPAAKAVFADEYSLRVAFGGSLTEQEINLGLFSKKGAEEHTLVMIREKKDGAGSTKCGTGAPEDGSAFNAHNLNEHLKQVMQKDSEETWISFDEKTYLDKAEEFLERVIKRQIIKVKEEEKKETAFERECRELQESLSAEAGDYIDADGRLERLRRFSDEIRGKAGLVKGKQGSGKSTLLRHYVLDGQEQCAGVFADLQGGRATVDSALGFLAGVLQQRGLLEVMPPRYPGESSAGYFERQLEGLKKDAKVTLVVDCAENIPDFKLQEKSLFSMNLPAGVTLLVSCVDENSLSKTDLLYAPPVFEIRDVRKEEAFPMLLGMLEKYGRTLTGWQQEKIRRALPDEETPLYLRMLADLLRLIPGYNENCGRSGQYVFDRPLPENAYLLAQESLAREMQAYLPGLYRHLLACIVLSAQGMQEEELIGILLREVTEGSSLHAEILGNSHWNITSMEHVLNVFWSRMRFRLQSFLGTYPSYGNLLIRFRHGLMREAALAVISGTPDGQRADDPRTDILQETSLALRDFWMEQSPYLETKPEDPKATGNAASSAPESTEAETEGEVHKVVVNAAPSAQESGEAETEGAIHKVTVNRRRADELYPILQYRGEIKT
ncbi:MAG: hypothetical protein Q4D81_14315, partial [Eubacteriales bacterium]|nr:hypothetical protein [Eubacteriales bacterium]